MPPTTSSERQPLLGNPDAQGNGGANRPVSTHSLNPLPNQHRPTSPSPLQPHKKLTPLKSFRNLLLSGWVNLLLVAVPLSFISHFLHWGSTADFIISFIAIIPLAGLLGDATEQVSLRLGQTLGGLLNATFGNAVEAIVGIIALVNNELRIVQTSMLGSILSNLLLVLGCSFLAAGWNFKESNFQVTAAQASASLMTLACITLIIPAAYHMSNTEAGAGAAAKEAVRMAVEKGGEALKQDADLKGLLVISRATALILILMYCAYLYFQLSSHAYLYEAEEEGEEEEAKMDVYSASAALLIVTVITSFCADYLVASIDEFAAEYDIPKAFIGLILIPIVGNAAEHFTSVWMAAKGKMEITIGVSVGSSIQIAVGVIPILVLVGWIIGRELTLYFETFETVVLTFSVLLVNMLIQDGKSNYMEGAMLVALYLVIAVAMWVS